MLRPAQRRLVFLTAAFALSLLSCGREVTGPDNGILTGRRIAGIAIAPVMPALMQLVDGAGEAVPFTKVRVVLRNEDGSVAKDTLVDFPSTADSVALSLQLPIPNSAPVDGLPLSLTLAYVNAAGDTVFRGGPTAIVARPLGSSGANDPIVIPVTYDGVGKDAARVAIAPKTSTGVAGNTRAFTAAAFNAQNQAIANTPFVFFSLDTARAQINPVSGVASLRAVRGNARIVASLPNGLRADTATIAVSLPASLLLLTSGNAQTGSVNALLADSIVLRTLAIDSIPVAGVIVSFAVATGNGSLATLSDTSDANGAVSTRWTLGGALGAQTITATATGLTGSPLTITATGIAGTPTRLDIVTQPSTVTAGTAMAPAVVVQARDAFGNAAPAFTGAVTIAVAGALAPALGGTATRTAVNGVATFNDLSITAAGSYTLVVSSGTLISDTTTSIRITPAAAAVLDFVSQPSDAVAGEALVPPVTVRARDAFGNVDTAFTGTVALSLLNGGSAVLSGSTSQAAVNGLATFSSLSVNLVGATYSLRASSGALTPDTSSVFGITPSAPTQIALISGGAQAGVVGAALAQPIVVDVRDAQGNVVPGVTVNFSIVTGGGTTLPTNAATNASGQASTAWTLGSAVGAQELRASLAVAPTVFVAVPATATPGAPAQVVVTQAPTAAIAGTAFSPAVIAQLRDANGNVVTSFNGDATLSLGTGPVGAALFGTTTVTAVNGVATFSTVNAQTAGAGYTLVASASGFSSAASAAFSVAPNVPAQFGILDGNNQTSVAGSAFPSALRVYVRDQYGNPIAGAVTTWSAEAVVTLAQTSVLTDANGIATNTATMGLTLGAQSTGPRVTTAGLGTELIFVHTVTAGAASSLVIASGPIGPLMAGSTSAPVRVEARDALGNLATTFADSVSVSVQSGPHGAPTDSLHAVAVAGVATFSTIDLPVAGTYVLRFAATGLGNVLSNSFAVSAAAAAFVFPDSAASGNGQTGTVAQPLSQPLRAAVRDAFGNGVAGVTVVFTATRGTDTLGVTPVLTDATGIASFTPTLPNTAGLVNYFATSVGLSGSGFQYSATALAAAAAQLVSTNRPAPYVSQLAGAPILVEARDALGNVASGYTGDVSLLVETGPAGAVLGLARTRAATAGVVSFDDLTLNLVGTYSLRFTAAGLGDGLLDTLVVIAGAPANLVILSGNSQILSASSPLPDSLAVRVTDAIGNPVQGVNVTWAALLGGGSVSPATSVTNASGVARAAWLLGSEFGTQTVTANVVGLTQVTFSASAISTNASFVWLGNVSSSLADSANWAPYGRPVPTDSILVPAGRPNYPVLQTNIISSRVTIDSGATVTVGNFYVSLTNGFDYPLVPSVIADTGGIVLNGTTGTIRGRLPKLYVLSGAYVVNGPLVVDSSTIVAGGADLAFGSSPASIGLDLITTTGGTISMGPGSLVTVGRSAGFDGGSTAGRLTGGTLRVAGNIQSTVTGSPQAFSASANHVVELIGTSAQGIQLAFPDADFTSTCSASCFGTLRSVRTPSAGIVGFLSNAKALNRFELPGDSINATGRTLVSAGTPNFGTSLVVAAKVGWQTGLQRSGLFVVDTLVAWGADTTLIAVQSVPTLVLGQYRLSGAHLGRIVVGGTAGSLDVAGTATVGGGTGIALRTTANGRVIMQDPTDTLRLAGSAEFGGVTVPGNMTAGVLELSGSLVQSGTGTRLLAEGGHLTRFTGASPSITFADTAANQLNAVEFAGSGVVNFASAARVAGNVTVGGTVSSIGNASATRVRLGGDLVDTLGGRWAIDTTQFDGVDPQLPDSITGSVILTQGAALDSPLWVTGNLTVSGGTLDVAFRRLVVGGTFRTQATGVLRMVNAVDSVVVFGPAIFGGGASTELSAGHLALHGDFAQALGDAEAFSASGTHQTWFVGSAAQTIGFSNPGAGAGTSHFANLGIAQQSAALSVQLNADSWATGQLLTSTAVGRRFTSGFNGAVLTTGGANVTGVVFDNARWAVNEGAAIATLDSVQFVNQDPVLTELAVERGSGTIALSNAEFATTPTTGRYLRVNDINGATGGVLTVNVSNPTPAVHGGSIDVLGGAVVNGWDAALLVLATAPSSGAEAGGLLSPVTVEFRNSGGQVLTSYNGPVTLELVTNPTSTILIGTTTVNAVNGVATFDEVAVGLPGTGYQLRGTQGSFSSDLSAAFSVVDPVVPVDSTSLAAGGQTGQNSYCGLSTAGTAYCWGSNIFGQLGNGDLVQRLSPTAVAGGLAFNSIQLGNGFGCGVVTIGDIYCWGRGGSGQLGDGVGANSSSPVLVSGGLSWRAVDVGTLTTCGLTDVGQVYCWGNNSQGRVGDGTTVQRNIPTAVSIPVRFTKVNVGGFSACGLTAAGFAYCWGAGSYIGNGSTDNALSPVVGGGGLRYAELELGDLGSGQFALTCGVTISAQNLCWGLNDVGGFGNGGISGTSPFPSPVPGISGLVVNRLSIINRRGCATDASNSAYCWGQNRGTLGNGTFAPIATLPTPVSGGIAFNSVVAGPESTCGISTTGAAYCWGALYPEALGNGTTTFTSTPTALPFIANGNTLELSNTATACTRASSGEASCWGLSVEGSLGTGSSDDFVAFPQAISGGNQFLDLALGSSSCGVDAEAGALFCWGTGINNGLGTGTLSSAVPIAVPSGDQFTSVSRGGAFTCALSTIGTASCWGLNLAGQLGRGVTSTSEPIGLVSTGLTFAELATGARHACGRSGAQVYCWGTNDGLQIGDGNTSNTPRLTPVAVAGGHSAQAVFAGSNHSCLLTSLGATWCWGAGGGGLLGNGLASSSAIPVTPTGAPSFTELALGNQHSCGLTAGGATYCWGVNTAGQLGDGTFTQRNVPVQVVGGPSFTSIRAGNNTTCGITSGEAVYCWGEGFARFGVAPQLTPAPVVGGITFRTP